MSKRTLSALNEAATLDANVKIVIFVRLDFPSGVQRFHTEIGSKNAVHPVYGSEVYSGIGDFGGINGAVKESISGAPIAITLALTGFTDEDLQAESTADLLFEYVYRVSDMVLKWGGAVTRYGNGSGGSNGSSNRRVYVK